MVLQVRPSYPDRCERQSVRDLVVELAMLSPIMRLGLAAAEHGNHDYKLDESYLWHGAGARWLRNFVVLHLHRIGKASRL